MKLSGNQIAQLETAMLNAYDLSGLRRMLRLELDRNLEHLVVQSRLQQMVFDLIELAEREGWLAQLIEAAVRGQPNNQQLKRTGDALIERLKSKPPTVNSRRPAFMEDTSSAEFLKRIEASAAHRNKLQEICDRYGQQMGFTAASNLTQKMDKYARAQFAIEPSERILLLFHHTSFGLAHLPVSGFTICDSGIYWGKANSLIQSEFTHINWFGLGQFKLVETSDSIQFGMFGYKVDLTMSIFHRHAITKLFRELHSYAKGRTQLHSRL